MHEGKIVNSLKMDRFGWDEIQKHNREEDAWIVVKESVYDVTNFAAIHPGGRDFILQHAGENVTGLMTQDDIHNHSDAAYSLLETYKIGKTLVSYGLNCHHGVMFG